MRYAHPVTGFANTLQLLQLELIMPSGPGSSGHRGCGETPYEEDSIARLSNQLVQLFVRVEADRQQRIEEAEAERNGRPAKSPRGAHILQQSCRTS